MIIFIILYYLLAVIEILLGIFLIIIVAIKMYETIKKELQEEKKWHLKSYQSITL